MEDLDKKPKSFEHYFNELQLHADDYHVLQDDETTVKVSSQLLARHTQLYWLEELTRNHQIYQVLCDEYRESKKSEPRNDKPYLSYHVSTHSSKSDGSKSKPHPEERIYRLAATNLFVEKAQAFLEQRAESYQRSGKTARRLASVIILFGAALALFQMFMQKGDFAHSWLELTSVFTRAFTTYGMIVLAAVGFWRYSKAMLDQAERLFERRHALRQGRLFVL